MSWGLRGASEASRFIRRSAVSRGLRSCSSDVARRTARPPMEGRTLGADTMPPPGFERRAQRQPASGRIGGACAACFALLGRPSACRSRAAPPALCPPLDSGGREACLVPTSSPSGRGWLKTGRGFLPAAVAVGRTHSQKGGQDGLAFRVAFSRACRFAVRPPAMPLRAGTSRRGRPWWTHTGRDVFRGGSSDSSPVASRNQVVRGAKRRPLGRDAKARARTDGGAPAPDRQAGNTCRTHPPAKASRSPPAGDSACKTRPGTQHNRRYRTLRAGGFRLGGVPLDALLHSSPRPPDGRHPGLRSRRSSPSRFE